MYIYKLTGLTINPPLFSNFMDMLSSHREKKLNCRIHAHTKEYLCLHPACEKNRLLCEKCVKQPQHRKHQIALIHRHVQPFSRLCFNAFDVSSKIHFNNLNTKYNNIRQIIDTSQQRLNSCFQDIKSSFLQPLQTIVGSYNMEMAESAIKTIENDAQPKLVNQIAHKINLLLKIEQKQYQRQLQRFQHIQECSVKIIAEMSSKVKIAIQTMKYQLSQISVLRHSKESENSKNQSIDPFPGNRSIQDLRRFSYSEHQIKNISKNQDSQPYDLLKLAQRFKHMENNQSQKMQEEPSMQLNSVSKPRNSIKKARRRKPIKTQIQQILPKKVKRLTKLQESLIIQKGNNPHKNEYPSAEIEELGSNSQNIVQNNEKSSSVSEDYEYSELNINSWTISADKQINELPKSCYKSIKRLKIQNLQTQPAMLFETLKKLVNLQEISIFDNVICEQNKINELMYCLPKSIKYIYFNCANEFSKDCISIIQKRKLTQITRLQYFFDIQRLLKRLDESLYFRDKQKGFRVQPLDNQDTLTLLERLPNLKNLWLKIKNFKSFGRKKNKFQSFESLVIGQLQEQNQDNGIEVINQKLNESLKHTSSLRCLVLLALQIQPQIFVTVIKNNQHLQTLYLESVIGVNEETMRLVTSPGNTSTKIINFSIKACPQITGAFVQELPNTEIFIMDHVQMTKSEMKGQQPKSPYKGYQKCNSLIYFNVHGNPYFSDQLFSTLRNSFDKLRSINLGFTCITQDSVELFKSTPEIECLCLDQNKLSELDILTICSYLPKIERLSLCGFDGEKMKGHMSSQLLNEIGLKLPQLRHLTLRNCCKMGYDLDLSKLPKLKTVQLDQKVGEQFISILRLSGIQVFDDLQNPDT